MKTWLKNTNNPIIEEEIRFLENDDFITVASLPKPALRRLVERVLFYARDWLYLIPMKIRYRVDEDDPLTIYGSGEPVDMLGSCSIFTAAFVVLIAPLWILVLFEDTRTKLGVITAFVTVLLGILTFGTLAKPFEVLAATAGYVTVLSLWSIY